MQLFLGALAYAAFFLSPLSPGRGLDVYSLECALLSGLHL